jgi:hypothetical protein
VLLFCDTEDIISVPAQTMIIYPPILVLFYAPFIFIMIMMIIIITLPHYCVDLQGSARIFANLSYKPGVSNIGHLCHRVASEETVALRPSLSKDE